VSRLNLELRADIHDEFKRNCQREGRSQSDVIRSLVLDWNLAKREERYHRKKLNEGTTEEDGG